MAQVHVTSNSGKKWIVIAGVAVVALGAAGYWFTQSEDGAEADRVVAVDEASSGAAPAAALPGTEFANPNPSPEESKAVLEQQKEAAKIIEAQTDMKPITGPITERPAFVSPMEWAMLQGVVQQHAQPDKELTRMVNFLRFMKQMEAYEALPRTPDNAAKRKSLANQLVEDLPNRVQAGDLDFKDAQGNLTQWLPDAEPDEQARQQRADAINKRMNAAAEAFKATQAKTE